MNKKIKNTSPKEFNGIKFKSSSEVMVYKTLTSLGFDVCYEPNRYSVWEGFKPTLPFYRPNKTGNLSLDNTKVVDITYTPDFVFFAPDKTVVIIEVKGFSNDVYPYKRKLFRKYLETLYKRDIIQSVVYFEIHNKKQLLQAIEIINNNYGKNSSRVDEGAD